MDEKWGSQIIKAFPYQYRQTPRKPDYKLIAQTLSPSSLPKPA